MNNEKLKEVKAAIKDAEAKIQQQENRLFDIFSEGLHEIFERNNLASISVSVSNHEFNDGDPTIFSLGIDYGMYADSKDGKTFEQDFYEGESEDTQSNKPLFKELSQFFNSFDIGGFYENHFGRTYDRATISFTKSGNIKIE